MQAMGFLSDKQSVKPSMSTSAIVPENFTHAHAVGQTGCGKTTSFIYPNLLSRIKASHSILLYDFKGKEHMSLKYLAHQEGRLDDVMEIGKPWGAKINLLRLMDRKALDIFIKNIANSGKDNPFWANAASKLFLSVYDVIYTLEKIHIFSKEFNAQKAFERTLHVDLTVDEEEFDYPYILSLKSIMPICQTEQNVSTFLNHLNTLQEQVHNFYLNIMLEHGYDESTSAEMQKQYKSFMHLFIQLKQSIKSSKISLAAFESVDETNPKLSIVMTLLPLVDIANREEFNYDDIDLLQALDTKKLISINAKDISNELLEAITYALFNQFSKRSMLMNVQPISVFIDEAQRVITKNQDYNLDVLRECKVEMFLAYQNTELMENKLGENEYKALMKNLTSSFYFNNSAHHKENDLSELKSFECLMSKDNYNLAHELEPLFLNKEALYEVENIYLNHKGIFNAYGLEKFANESIVLFDGRLFEENKIILYNIKTKSNSIQEIITPQDIENIENELQAFKLLIEDIILEADREVLELCSDNYIDEDEELLEYVSSDYKEEILEKLDDVFTNNDAA